MKEQANETKKNYATHSKVMGKCCSQEYQTSYNSHGKFTFKSTCYQFVCFFIVLQQQFLKGHLS